MKTISIRVDDETKKAAQEVAKNAGLTLSAVVNYHLKHIAATRRMVIYSFEPMTPKLEGLIAGVEKELQEGKISKKFTNADDFLADLNS